MANDLKEALHMKEGIGHTSYAKSSYIQKQVLSATRSIKEEAMKAFYVKQQPPVLCIADLGCSYAEENTLSVVSGLIETVEKARSELCRGPLDYQVYLNDLPKNDFNTLFKSLARFQDHLKRKTRDDVGHCFVNGVPGSFYERLFPDNFLHFVHSSYSLQWLSKEPEGIKCNKWNVYLSRTSPSNVVKAYYEQFEKDFSTFLRCRSKELVIGGKMVLTILGRRSIEPYSKECCHMWHLLSNVLTDMVLAGSIKEEKLSSFNIPNYYPSPFELELLVRREGSFALNQVHISEVSWNSNDYENKLMPNNSSHYDFANCIRSVTEPLIIKHFGESYVDEIFQRYQKMIHSYLTKEKNVFINITLELTLKG